MLKKWDSLVVICDVVHRETLVVCGYHIYISLRYQHSGNILDKPKYTVNVIHMSASI